MQLASREFIQATLEFFKEVICNVATDSEEHLTTGCTMGRG